MDKNLIASYQKIFDSKVKILKNQNGSVEYWTARELQELLGYKQWRNFAEVIFKAITAFNQVNGSDHISDFFEKTTTLSQVGSNATREVEDYRLARYACYLIAQNGDPKKPQIAFAQSYFAVQTRKMELIEQKISENERLEARARLTLSEVQLSRNIYERGVDSQGFGRIRSKGDAALFGITTKQMKARLGCSDNRPLADYLPTITLLAKNLATEMTNLNVERDDLQGEKAITNEHVINNKTIRRSLTDRKIFSENLPPAEDVKKLQRRVNKERKSLPQASLKGEQK